MDPLNIIMDHTDAKARPAQRHHSAQGRLEGYGWTHPTLAGVLSTLERMREAGVPAHAYISIGWPTVVASWSEDL